MLHTWCNATLCLKQSVKFRQIPSNEVLLPLDLLQHPMYCAPYVRYLVCQYFHPIQLVKFLYPSFTHSFVNSLKYCNNVTLVTSLKTTFFIVFHSFILLIAQYSHINNLRLDTLHHEFGPGMQVTVDWSRVANINI